MSKTEFFEEEMFNYFDPVDFSKWVKKMSYKGKATITFQFINDFLYLNSIWVEEEFRGQGVSHEILGIITTLSDKYKTKVELEVVQMGAVSEYDLVKLYKKYGFVISRTVPMIGMERFA